MARAITKTFGSKSVTLTIRRIDGGEMVTEAYEFANCKSVRAAKTALARQLNTNNFLVIDEQINEGAEQHTYTLDAETFDVYSQVCDENKSYGHNTVTTTFDETIVTFYTIASEEAQTCIIFGKTTPRKLRRMVAENVGDDNILIADTNIVQIRKWMPKDKFIELATEVKN